jgi:hypothetical protein
LSIFSHGDRKFPYQMHYRTKTRAFQIKYFRCYWKFEIWAICIFFLSRPTFQLRASAKSKSQHRETFSGVKVQALFFWEIKMFFLSIYLIWIEKLFFYKFDKSIQIFSFYFYLKLYYIGIFFEGNNKRSNYNL